MEHVAIMKKSWKLIDKILSGEKRIESRWYAAKFPPWNRIGPGDVVYFKDSAEPVTARAVVEKVLQFEDYSEKQLWEIIREYGGTGGICFVKNSEENFEELKKKKHCILIFLKNPEKIIPFRINKKGFGNACAWLCTEDIEKITKIRCSALSLA
ncbi:MAG: hypothetical protein V1659_02760 [Candidatus Woesearchaeota archaeon]